MTISNEYSLLIQQEGVDGPFDEGAIVEFISKFLIEEFGPHSYRVSLRHIVSGESNDKSML